MSRVKFYNKETGKWEYADSAYGSGGTVTDEQIASAVEDYMAEHPVTGGCVLIVETITVDDSGEPVNTPVTGLTLDYTTASLKVGDTIQLACEVQPSNATNSAVTWETSDGNVATVSNGLITAKAEGNVTITAKSVENPSIKATCAVSVVAAESGGGDESGGDDSGGDTVGEKIQFATLNIVDGSLVNSSGQVKPINSTAHYVEIPYIDGMFISATMNSSWVGGYPPFMVVTNGTYETAEYTMAETPVDTLPGSGQTLAYQTTTTLTGYVEGSTVIVNMYYADITANDLYYYTYGGER